VLLQLSSRTFVRLQRGQQQQPRYHAQQPAIDPAVLDGMDPETRAAVLAAQYGDAPPQPQQRTSSHRASSHRQQQPDAQPCGGGNAHLPAGAEDMPKFDIAGEPDELRKDLAVAADNVEVLRELVTADAPPEVTRDVVRRCQALRRAVHRVIDGVSDEGVLDYAVQVLSFVILTTIIDTEVAVA
jgi:hypothetical protein